MWQAAENGGYYKKSWEQRGEAQNSLHEILKELLKIFLF